MRPSHARAAISVRFDDPNLASCAGLVPVMALADRCGLPALLRERVKIAAKGGANAAFKILALVAGMVCGADSIEDMDLLRHGGMPRLFEQVRAPSTLGTFLRLFTFGHVRQRDAVAARLLPARARAAPLLSGGRRSRSSTSTTPCGRPTAMPSRVPVAATLSGSITRPGVLMTSGFQAAVSYSLRSPLRRDRLGGLIDEYVQVA